MNELDQAKEIIRGYWETKASKSGNHEDAMVWLELDEQMDEHIKVVYYIFKKAMEQLGETE